LTCESWNHLWLNEGFATYFGTLTFESLFNRNEFILQMDRLSRYVFESEIPRPTVRTQYIGPDDVFDEHIYDRGAWVLHMLRAKLGDALFFRGLRSYVQTFREKTVDTADFRRALERETGVDLSEFFQHWVYRGGFLKLKAGWKWDDKDRQVVLTLEQEPIAGTDVTYDLDVEVEIQMANDVLHRTVSFEERHAVLTIPVSEKPVTVRVDPEHHWLRTLEFERSADELIGDLDAVKSLWIRLDAVRALGKQKTDKSIRALGTALRSDSFWGVRRVAADALGEIAVPKAWDELLEGRSQPMAQVRAAVAEGLRRDQRPSTVKSLETWAAQDKSEMVVGEIAYGLALRRQDTSFPLLLKLAERRSHLETIGVKLFDGLGESGWEKGLDLALQKSWYGQPKRLRPSALQALGKIGSYQKDTRNIFDVLMGYNADPQIPSRRAAISALGSLGDFRAEPLLRKISKDDPDGGIQRAARGALDRLLKGPRSDPQLQSIRKELKDMQDQQGDLKRRLEYLEKTSENKPVTDSKPAEQ
jgi:aminopeptidase N